MKKVFGLLAAAAVLSTSVAFAQDQQSHDVNIEIPNVLGIRLTNQTTGDAAVTNPTAVEFILNDGQMFGGGEFVPSNLGEGNWDDVKVFSNVSGFDVEVEVTNGLDFNWNKVSFEADGLANGTFQLGALSPNIVTGAAKTNAWASLGFGPDDFKLMLDGSEDAGNYSTEVTYTVTLP